MRRKLFKREGVKRMAKTVSITDREGFLEIIVDGKRMTEIISYKLEGSYGRNTLTLVTEIMESLTATSEAPN